MRANAVEIAGCTGRLDGVLDDMDVILKRYMDVLERPQPDDQYTSQSCSTEFTRTAALVVLQLFQVRIFEKNHNYCSKNNIGVNITSDIVGGGVTVLPTPGLSRG